MEEKNVHQHRPQENQRQRDKLPGKHKHPTHKLHQEDELHMERIAHQGHVLSDRSGRSRCMQKVKKPVQSEEHERQAQ